MHESPAYESPDVLVAGRWPELLSARGIDPACFNGKAQPCPLCGGTDRFKWYQNKNGGRYFCRGCTNGKYANGIQMLMEHMNYRSYREACDDVRDYFGVNPSHVAPVHRSTYVPQEQWTPEQKAASRSKMLRTWNEAREVVNGDPVSRYWNNRVPGFNLSLQALRFHPALEYWAPPPQGADRPVSLGKFPAMLAFAMDANGELAQLHKTFLTPDGFKANVPKPKLNGKGVGANNFAVRLAEPQGDTLGICEGLETAWAAMMLDGTPVWSCLNGGSMAKFELPEYLHGQIRRLVIYADHDQLKPVGGQMHRLRRAGSAYAEQCAVKARAMGLKALIVKPAKSGADFADYYEAQAQAA